MPESLRPNNRKNFYFKYDFRLMVQVFIKFESKKDGKIYITTIGGKFKQKINTNEEMDQKNTIKTRRDKL